MSDEKRVFHQSSLTTFEFCKYRFAMEEFGGKKQSYDYGLLRGKGCHKARDENFEQKIDSRVDMSAEDLCDVCVEEVRSVLKNNEVRFIDELEGLSKVGVLDKLAKKTKPLIHLDRKLLMPSIQPAYTEKYICVELPDYPFDIAGILDTICEDGLLVDEKTSKRKWTQERVDDTYQATHYWLMGRVFLGREPKGFAYDILEETKKGNRAYRLITSRSELQIKSLLERYRAMYETIELGNYPPCHNSCWWCSERFCPLWLECKYVQK